MFKPALFAVVMLSVLAGCGKAKKVSAGGGSADVTALGDLSEFKKIAEDTLAIVEKKDMAAAKIRIKDLEKAWDDAEAAMRPKSETAWTSVDKAIDHALAAVRADNPNPEECALKLKTVMVRMTPKAPAADAPAK